MTDARFTYQGLACTPIPSTFRHVAGGRAIDVLFHDPRTTCTYATVNADLVREERSEEQRAVDEAESWMNRRTERPS